MSVDMYLRKLTFFIETLVVIRGDGIRNAGCAKVHPILDGFHKLPGEKRILKIRHKNFIEHVSFLFIIQFKTGTPLYL